MGLGAFGAVLGGDARGQIIEELAAFSAGSVLLKYSRTAETEADVMGTQILYDAGYDPRAMAQFFEKLQADSQGGGQVAQFFSDHPNPENRVARVDQEVRNLGGAPGSAQQDSSDFRAVKPEVQKLPVLKPQPAAGVNPGKPAPPSANLAAFQGETFSVKYPDNWQKYGEGNAVSFAPENGILADKNGQAALAYGIIISVAREQQNGSNTTLEAATDQLVASLQKSNPAMKVQRAHERVRLNGYPALSTTLVNDSAAGGQERDWLITVLRPEGLVYFVCVAPEAEFGNYNRAFEAVLDSVRFQK